MREIRQEVGGIEHKVDTAAVDDVPGDIQCSVEKCPRYLNRALQIIHTKLSLLCSVILKK